jgi:RNA polymerase-interacting CarD/CdnL/TRCF family regulator
LIRDLHGRDSIKALSYDEKETYEKAENTFITEWTITNPSLSQAEAKNQLREALAASIQKRKLAVEEVS